MASQNVLLGSGIPVLQPIAHKERNQKRTPAWRYHKDCPKGTLIRYDEELDKVDAAGWVDHPGKVARLPGLEKIYDDFHNKPPSTSSSDKTLKECSPQVFNENLKITPVLTSEQLEDMRKAEALKAASDLVEKKRMEEYEKAQNPPAEYQCLVCPKKFPTIKALNMHGLGAHRNKKNLTPDEKNLIQPLAKE